MRRTEANDSARERRSPAAGAASAGQPTAPAEPPRAEPTKVLLKGLAVLEALAKCGGESGVSELARATAIDKATVHRLLNTLCTAGFVARHDPRGRYRLTDRLAMLAGHRAPPSLMELALPCMREL